MGGAVKEGRVVSVSSSPSCDPWAGPRCSWRAFCGGVAGRVGPDSVWISEEKSRPGCVLPLLDPLYKTSASPWPCAELKPPAWRGLAESQAERLPAVVCVCSSCAAGRTAAQELVRYVMTEPV